jgi:bacteriocin biosynthesis cyclodehydratase domain-containing protein
MASFSEEELQRYSRQIALRTLGLEGQAKLKGARVSVIGVGGLGCFSSIQLTSMGVGYLRLIDQDVVDITNLHRQILYDTESLGYPKVEIAQKRLTALNPHVEIDARPLTVNEETADDLVKDVDVVLDGLDHFAPRYAINKACVRHQVPYVYGGVLETYGNISTFIPGKTACLECVLGRIRDEGMPTCETVGVLPSILATVTSIQVSEAVKLLTGSPPALANKMLFIDLRSLSFTAFDIVRRESCPTCGSQAIEVKPPTSEAKVVELCGKDSFMASPKQPVTLNLAEVADLLKEQFTIKRRSTFGLSLERSDGVSISLMKTGNALIKGVSDTKNATVIYDELMTAVTKTGRSSAR